MNWDRPPNSSPGPEEYVGWTLDPTITFFFSGTVNINVLVFYVDNSLGRGGVSLPFNFHVVMGATTLDFPVEEESPSFGAPGGHAYAANLSGSSLELTITRRNTWVMMSEVFFHNTVTTGVPEPVTSALIGLGLVGLAILRPPRDLVVARAILPPANHPV